MRLSALVGTRNRLEALLRCVRGLKAQGRRPDEIIVLDDASDALDVRARLAEHGFDEASGVRVIRTDVPLGVGRGRNVLFANATGDAFVVLDDDAWIEDLDFLHRVEEELRARPAAAILAVRIVDHRADGDHLLVPFPRRARAADEAIVDRAQCVSYFLGGAHIVRRDVYRQVGGYDDAFVWGEEELDLAFRVVNAGHEIHYLPTLVVHHRAEPAVLPSGAQLRSELYFHVRNRFVLARKFLPHRVMPSYLLTWMVRYAADAVRSADLAGYLRGIGSGFGAWSSVRRERLTPRAMQYLAAHHGRLWY